jgi:NADPH:quinone reductase-like Zn-dependent oxidoreductase
MADKPTDTTGNPPVANVSAAPSFRAGGPAPISRAIWYTAPGVVEIRSNPLESVSTGHALVRTTFSGISRGTERLVMSGTIGRQEWERMRAPMQEGAFPFPVKYGYCATGTVEEGPTELRGRTVFCLHPHQDCFIAPVEMLAPVPDTVPARRATLAANMETALNAIWDSGASAGDRIVVVGAGVIGLLVAYLAARLPGADVSVVDVAPDRRGIVEAFGARFVTADAAPADAPRDADVVFHTSVSAAGLNTAIDCAGMEATVVELSWYGDRDVPARLGGAFHSRRLRLQSSQVGQVSPSRRPRWSYRRRLEKALALLADPALDALVADEISFDDAPTALPRLLGPGAAGLAPVIRY